MIEFLASASGFINGVSSAITDWVAGIFGNHVWLATAFISMIPVTELKFAIPFAQNHGYGLWSSLAFGMIGSLIIVPLLALFFAPIIKWLKTTKCFKKMAIKIEKKVKAKSDKIKDSAGNVDEKEIEKKKRKQWLIKFFGVMLFVAVPIPLTGVWTGTCIAVILGLNFWSSCGAVLIGNFFAGLIISILSKLIGEENVLLLMLLIVAVIIIGFIVKFVIDKIKHKKSKA